MNKDIVEHISYDRGEEEGYKKGLLDGYTKSIVLIRHLQRTYNNMNCEQEILNEAMELIAQKIEVNNNE
jgi:hypothetical protein